MAIGKHLLDNNCYEYFADNGDMAWITVFDGFGYRVVGIGYWRESEGGSEWAVGPFKTEEEAIRAGETTARY